MRQVLDYFYDLNTWRLAQKILILKLQQINIYKQHGLLLPKDSLTILLFVYASWIFFLHNFDPNNRFQGNFLRALAISSLKDCG